MSNILTKYRAYKNSAENQNKWRVEHGLEPLPIMPKGLFSMAMAFLGLAIIATIVGSPPDDESE